MQNPIVVFKETECEQAVVFIHPIGGQVYWYKEISSALFSEACVYALMSPMLLGDQVLKQSIKETAEHYVRIILDKPRRQHYVLVGWSYGSEIAFEMAKHLEKLQISVSLVVLDPQVMLKHKQGIHTCFLEVLSKEFQLPLENQTNDFNKDFADIDINDFVEKMCNEKLIKPLYKKYYIMALRVYLLNLQNMHEYTRDGTVKKIVLIENTQDDVDHSASFTFMRSATNKEWMHHAAILRLAAVKGNHYTMLKGDSAKLIASQINECMQEIRQ